MALLYGFGDLLYAFLLVINALAVLSEERFLARVGWSSSQATQQAYSGYEQTPEESIKQRLVHLIAAVRTLLRIPLIGFNVLVIAYELVLGG